MAGVLGLLGTVVHTALMLGGIYFWFLVFRILRRTLPEKYRRWRWRRIRVRAMADAAFQWRDQHRSVS